MTDLDEDRTAQPNAISYDPAPVRAGIAEAFARIGGARRLADWAREDAANERIFWERILPKLLPLEREAERVGAIDLSALDWLPPS